MVRTFQDITGIRAKYVNTFTRAGLLDYFPAFAKDELLVRELLRMVGYAVEYGYFQPECDLSWYHRLHPDALT